MDKVITIDDVSAKAKVSKTTVSRYLNGKYEYMSESTRERIKNVIEELGYRPNITAQSLKSKKSGLIGMVIADITNNFSSILVKGVNDVCANAGYQLLVVNTDNNKDKEKEYIESMLDRQVEGIIVNTAGGNEEYLQSIASQGIMIVLADRIVDGVDADTVTTNNEIATEECMKHLKEEGFEKVAFFTQRLDKNSSRLRRYESFIKSSQKYFGEQNPNELVYIIDNDSNRNENECILRDTTEKCVEHFLNIKGNKKCIFNVNGVATLDTIKAIKKMELNQKIGVCGFDDWEWAELIGDGITSVRQPSYEVGVTSAKCMIDRLNNPNKEHIGQYVELKATIVKRGSTKLL